jgi:hypothetical protein
LQGLLDTTLGGFSPGTPVSSTNKTDRHNIAEILLKVAFFIGPSLPHFYIHFAKKKRKEKHKVF